MTTKLSSETIALLRKTIAEPWLANSRELESHLIAKGYQRKIFARFNQQSSIYAASESDRGIIERLSNAFDASLTAARRLAGYAQSDRTFTPRNAAQRFLNPNQGLMLNRESQGLDLQESRLAEQRVEVDAQGMCCEFGVEARAQAPEGMGMIDFNLELAGELCIHRFNHLTN